MVFARQNDFIEHNYCEIQDSTLLCSFNILNMTTHLDMTSLTTAFIVPALCHALF